MRSILARAASEVEGGRQWESELHFRISASNALEVFAKGGGILAHNKDKCSRNKEM